MKIVKPIVINNYGFSRATIATYYDASGIIQTAGIDVLRLGYDPTTLEFLGPIIEGAATNLLTKSIAFGHANWVKSGSMSIGSGYPPDNPDGSSGGALYTDSVSDAAYLEQTLPEILSDNVLSFSLYVNVQTSAIPANTTAIRLSIISESTTTTAVFNLYDGTALASYAQIKALPNNWFRISLYGNVQDGTGTKVRIEIINEARFFLWGAQAEFIVPASNVNPTSFILTDSTTETRAADIESNPPSLVTSNVDENDYPDWDDETAYADGDFVIVRGDYHRVYQSTGDSTNVFPPENPSMWVDNGATNRWRMFDMNVGSEKQTVSDDSDNIVNTLLSVDELVTAIVLLNVDAVSAQIIMRDSEGVEVYNRKVSFLLPPSEATWWAYLFELRSRATTLVLTDLPPVYPATIELILDGGGDPAKIGKEIIGSVFEMGCARYGTGVGILDFSRKERDPFGNNFVLERRYVDRVEFDVQLQTSRVHAIKNWLADVRATPVVYIGEESYLSTAVFGFYRDFSIILSGPKRSDCSLEVEGI